MKKLVVRVFEVTEDSDDWVKGERYSYFQDPETGKWYQPVDGFTVTSDEDLSDRFYEAAVGENTDFLARVAPAEALIENHESSDK